MGDERQEVCFQFFNFKEKRVLFLVVPTLSIFAKETIGNGEVISNAEINAIINCTKPPRFLFTVLSPCISCAKTISATSTEEVYYIQQYFFLIKSKTEVLFICITVSKVKNTNYDKY